MWPPKTILLATDFSENSQQAFEFACQLASSSGSKVIVLHAYTPDIVALRDMPPMPVEIENEDDAHRKLAQIQVRQPGVIVEHKLVKGTAVEVIVHAAQSTGADLLEALLSWQRGRSCPSSCPMPGTDCPPAPTGRNGNGSIANQQGCAWSNVSGGVRLLSIRRED
jgi:hypothetical protein